MQTANERKKAIKQKMAALISRMPKRQIIAVWEWTEKTNSDEAYIIRGAIMDYMERFDSQKFDKWIDEDLPLATFFD